MGGFFIQATLFSDRTADELETLVDKQDLKNGDLIFQVIDIHCLILLNIMCFIIVISSLR